MPRQKRKTYLSGKGYARYKDSNRYVHRQVAKKKLGRPLRSREVVHHRDGDKLNNRPDNLQVMTRRDHNRLHFKEMENAGCSQVLASLAVLAIGGLIFNFVRKLFLIR
jgi:hypothetical protein